MNPKSCTLNIWLLLSFLFFSEKDALTQNFNPPFPRIGQITFYSAGAGPTIWENHDLVMIRHYKTEDARRIKEKNPDVILLAANDAIEANRIGNNIPEEWYSHYANGQRVQAWGGYLMNITEYCPKVNHIYGSQNFNEFLAQYLVQNTDWNYFDGTIFDSWSTGLWVNNVDQIDFDYDGRADGGEATPRWNEGNRKLVERLRSLLPQDKQIIIAHEAGELFLNGNGFEFWSQVEDPPGGHDSNLKTLFKLRDNAVTPIINYCNGEVDGASFRADLTSAMLGDAFFGHDEGTAAHRWTFLHDEYEANLGYPTAPPQEIESGLWIRYFDNGAIISNISGSRKTVMSSQLAGGPYWRFQGAQDPILDNGDPFDQNHPISLDRMDGILLFKQPTTLVTPIVIDNVAKNMTSLGQNPVEYSGSWRQVLWDETSGDLSYSLGYGWDEFAHPYAVATGTGTATYRPNFGLSGKFEVFEWHSDSANDGQGDGCANVKITINSASGVTQKIINQKINAGRWNSLGVYDFNKGNSGSVVLSAPGSCTTISDAVRFVYRDSDYTTDTTPPIPPRGVKVSN